MGAKCSWDLPSVIRTVSVSVQWSRKHERASELLTYWTPAKKRCTVPPTLIHVCERMFDTLYKTHSATYLLINPTFKTPFIFMLISSLNSFLFVCFCLVRWTETSAPYIARTCACWRSSFWTTRLCTTTWSRFFFTCSHKMTPKDVTWSATSPRYVTSCSAPVHGDSGPERSGSWTTRRLP